MARFKLYWAPEGRPIGWIEALSKKDAVRKAPAPYCRYKGELYANSEEEEARLQSQYKEDQNRQ